jgi:glycosyltransferase involved in cell wall biosynthesis
LKVSLIIPVYNEELHLKRFLAEVDRCDLGIPKELVIIDDCSVDQSREIVENFSFHSEVKFVSTRSNCGKGAAIRTGIEMATGNIIGIQDADFEYSLKDIPKILDPILRGEADVVYGSRFKKSHYQVHRTYHYLVNRFLTILNNLLSGLYLTDMETCYKFFRADILKSIHLEADRFGFEPEITAKVARLKVRLMEVPISYFPRTYLEGKKITWRDGIAAIRHIIVFNLLRSPRKMFKSSMPEHLLLSKRSWL